MKNAMSQTGRLRLLLRRRRQEILDKAMQSDCDIDPQEFESLGRLEKLYGLSTAKSVGIEILIGGIVVLLVLSLLLLRVSKAEIELQVEATKARFIVNTKTAIFGDLPVRWITVQGHQSVAISPAVSEDVIKSTNSLFTADLTDSEFTAMSLMIPDLPSESLVELSHWPDGTREIALCNMNRPVPLILSSRRKMKTRSQGSVPMQSSVRVLIVPAFDDEAGGPANSANSCRGAAMLHFRFLPAKPADINFSRDLSIHDLQLYESPLASGQLLSTIVSGQFRLSSSKAGVNTLFPNDLLDLGSSSGRIRSLTMGEKTTRIVFQGDVSTLSIGSAAMRRSLMPSMLEWWLSRDLILVAWSAGLSGIAFLLGVYRWFAQRK